MVLRHRGALFFIKIPFKYFHVNTDDSRICKLIFRVKVKVKLFLYVTSSSTNSVTSALDGGEWSASHPGRFSPRETAPRSQWSRAGI
jgi:hypothetical protein